MVASYPLPINIKIYDPQVVEPIELDTSFEGTYVLLTLFDDQTPLERLQDLIQSALPEVSGKHQGFGIGATSISWVIYAYPAGEEIAGLLGVLEPLAASAPEIQIVLLAEEIAESDQPALFQRCHAYLSLSGSSEEWINALKALAMDKQLICTWPGESDLWSAEHCFRPEAGAGLRAPLLELAAGSSRTGNRAHLMQYFNIRPPLDLPAIAEAILHNTRAAAIIPWQRSGTFFMHSLLDSHPEVLTIPLDTFAHFYEDQAGFLENVGGIYWNLPPEEIARLVAALNPALFDASHLTRRFYFDPQGSEQALSVDPNKFQSCLSSLLQELGRQGHALNRRLVFIAVYYAYEWLQKKAITHQRLIVCHIHFASPDGAIQQFLEDFPQAQALLMFRHPAQNLYSSLDNALGLLQEAEGRQAGDGHWVELVYTRRFQYVYKAVLAGWGEILKKYDLPHQVIRLEALNSHPRSAMEEVARFLQIAWHENLLKSTFNGLAYWGEKRTARIRPPQHGFTQVPSQNRSWKSCIGRIDGYVLRVLLHEQMTPYGYRPITSVDKLFAAACIFLPTKLERQALWQALKHGQRFHMESAFINMLERWVGSFLKLFGHDLKGFW